MGGWLTIVSLSHNRLVYHYFHESCWSSIQRSVCTLCLEQLLHRRAFGLKKNLKSIYVGFIVYLCYIICLYLLQQINVSYFCWNYQVANRYQLRVLVSISGYFQPRCRGHVQERAENCDTGVQHSTVTGHHITKLTLESNDTTAETNISNSVINTLEGSYIQQLIIYFIIKNM